MCLDPDFDPRSLKPTPVPLPYTRGSKASDQVAFVVENLLTPDECTRLLALTHQRGYERALVNIGGGRQAQIDDVRKSGRCILDSPGFAKVLWQRIGHMMPHMGRGKGWPIELNERFRFLRYVPGDYFRPHRDGSYPRPGNHPNYGDKSCLTVMIYLDEPTKGGQTNFINEHKLSTDESRVTSVVPRVGMGLVFEHQLYHEGAELLEGTKHAIRTDVMCRNVARPPTKEAVQAVEKASEEKVSESLRNLGW